MSQSSLPTSVHRRLARVSLAILASCALFAPLVVVSPAAAAPPLTATLVSPADGSVSPGADPQLSVGVSDPDGDPLSVTFEGRRKGATVPGPTNATPFTFVVVPDIQNYTTATRAPIIAQQTQWIVDNRARLNTQFVVQVGDLVNEWNTPSQWSFASNGLKVLNDNGVPNAVVPGNHDFDNVTGAHTAYDTWFPPSRFQNAAWTPTTADYGGYMGQNQFGADAEDRGNMNNYSLFTAGGVDWLVLGLEWEASATVLEWADRVLAAHPDRQVIMFTHAFLNLPGLRRTFAQRPGGTPPETTWQTFVRTHCQVRLVVNGHEHNGDLGESRRTDDNSCGRPVHQILSDYQERVNGGNGWLRYYTFNPAENTMTAFTYSPTLGQFETDADSSFTLPYALTPPVPAPFTPIATVSADSGATATASWPALARDTDYEWRARVSDGDTTTVSTTWTLRTPRDSALARDQFERGAVNGWGSADVGGAWTLTGSPSRYSVTGGAGVLTLASSTAAQANLSAVSSSNTKLVASFSVDKIAAAQYISFIGRQVGTEQYLLRLRVGADGTVQLLPMRGGTAIGGSYTVPGLTIVPGTLYTVAFEVRGTSPTTLAAKMWRASAAEPAAWQLTRSDGTAALQAPGNLGLSSYVPSAANAYPVKVSFTEIIATDPTAAPPANQIPNAAFTTSAANLAVSVDATASTDSDGTVTSYAWTFGDGSSGTGVTSSHTYAVAGTYTVTLKVTDEDGGVSAPVSKPVTVSTPPPVADVLAQDLFERTAAGGWGIADKGGAWTVAGTASRYSVAGGSGVMTVPSSTAVQANLTGVASANSRVSASLSVDKIANAQYIALIGRQVGADQYLLRARVAADGTVQLYVLRNAVAVGVGVTVPGLVITPGTVYTIVFEAKGTSPTSLSGKMWKASDPEPAGWQLTRTDTTAALQTAGNIGIYSYVPSAANAYPLKLSVAELTVRDPTAP